MIVCYLRSSSIGTLGMCEMQYFFQYTLGFKGKTNKKAVLGTIMHRAMQILGDKKIAQDNNKRKVINDDIENLTLKQCDDIEYITTISFNHYKEHETDVDLTPADLRQCIRWVEKAIAYNDGDLDPRNQNIVDTELFFDIEIKEDWAKYDYEVNGEKISGYLSIKGTVDVIIKEDETYFRVLDYKSGKRLNWATGKEKTYECLTKDPQLLLYYYALKRKFPEREFYVSIYYVNDGGIFDIAFDEDDFKKAENMIKQKFQFIKNVQVPKQISREQTHWKCKYLCAFSEINEETGISTCNEFHEMVKSEGIDEVTAKHGNVKKLITYGDGGGRLAEDEKKTV
jgi:CRISPR/Cas system-associated exonuclease Cas4 (RecB family)